ncbi:hypothetical protein MtrunA17_Chr1g0169021 [Medicago truncatula]|uniref:Uncharacterized protein n=1 Tax=Medicago truncatula TaxID=3880 RepID=A0A396JKC3_MEDTR|nr:hypothetical protein MtrunA17_Chr1g0169021 [Medicago truncatula]
MFRVKSLIDSCSSRILLVTFLKLFSCEACIMKMKHFKECFFYSCLLPQEK